MMTINFSDADLAALRYWRFHHPDPRVQVRMEALYLRRQGVANRDIPPLVQPPELGLIQEVPEVGGLHHHDEQRGA
jgi:hypothetical protein